MSHFWRHRFQQAHGVQVLTLYPGRIIALYASVGDDVKKGQTLFTIGRLRVVNCSTPAAAIRVDSACRSGAASRAQIRTWQYRSAKSTRLRPTRRREGNLRAALPARGAYPSYSPYA
jgi:multidrug efflux pump subunit AcrA (membrane-fusion protein)